MPFRCALVTEPADPKLLAACCRLAVDLAPTEPDLRAWWTQHQPAIRSLPQTQREWLVGVKDARRIAWQDASQPFQERTR